MNGRRRTSRHHAAMRDLDCPGCGERVYRSHVCRARPVRPLTPAELEAAAAACRQALAGATTDDPAQLELF